MNEGRLSIMHSPSPVQVLVGTWEQCVWAVIAAGPPQEGCPAPASLHWDQPGRNRHLKP